MTSTATLVTDTITTVSGSVWTIEYGFGQTFVTRQPADPEGFGLVHEYDGIRVPCNDASVITYTGQRVLLISGGPLDRMISGFITDIKEG